MNLLAVTTAFCLCLSTCFATFGPEYNNHHGGSRPQHHYDAPKGKPEESQIHLNSPKIILNRPSISVHSSGGHGSLLDDEPIFLEHDKPLYIRKTLHGIPATHAVAAHHPYAVDAGYGAGGKALDIGAPIQVYNHAPVVQGHAILIRRPVVVSKGLTATQDHLERLHYAHSGSTHTAGYSHGGYSVPVSKALHERTVVYGLGHGGYGSGHGGHGSGHGVGHVVPSYSAPLVLEQPKAYGGHTDIAYSSGKGHHGAVLHGGAVHGHAPLYHGGALQYGHGAVLHGGALHGHAPLYHGGALQYGHGAVLHGGALHGHAPLYHGGAVHGHGQAKESHSSHGASSKKY